MNLFDIDKIPNDNELIEILAESKNFRIERIISSGHFSPKGFWYDQDENEFVAFQKADVFL